MTKLMELGVSSPIQENSNITDSRRIDTNRKGVQAGVERIPKEGRVERC